MDCVVEESAIRAALEPLPGVNSLRVRLRERTVTVHAEDAASLEQALVAIRKQGFEALPVPASPPISPGTPAADRGAACCAGEAMAVPHAVGAASGSGQRRERSASHKHDDGHAHAHGDDHTHHHAHDHDHSHGDENPARLAVAFGLALAAELLDIFAGHSPLVVGLGMALAVAAIWLAGTPVYLKGLRALRALRLNIDALMAVAVTGAFLIGEWPEAAMVMTLYAIAELIEGRAVDRARHAISGLMALAPDTAQMRTGDGDWQTVPVDVVPVSAIVRVRPGERMPLDGELVEGETTVDQASVTGESMPVDKTLHDAVFAGTINLSATVAVRVTAVASESTLARIIDSVEHAQGSRAPTQRFIDRFAAVYTPAVFALALAVTLLGPWLFGWTAFSAIYRALVLLVIACPCALVIATPVTVVSGLAAAARRGVLVKGGAHLEGARKLRAVALDKTGTLTEGRPQLVAWQVLRADADRDRVERAAAALAGHSDHPVSRAIASGLIATHLEALDFRALPGRGAQARVEEATYVLGNQRLMQERGQQSPELQATLLEHESQGRTVSVLADDDGPVAMFAVADTVRPQAAAAVAGLKALGVHPVMLTGDNRVTAEAIGRAVGIEDVRGDLLPDDKLQAVQELQQRYGPTAMAGDGINDAPALARSNLGIAMGAAGTDIAMEAADVVVMNDDLGRIAETVRLSRRLHAILWQNISLALGIKAVFLVLALLDQATMWMAVFADMGASLLVVANGLRMLRGGDTLRA